MKNTAVCLSLSLFLLILSGCYYTPFVKYSLNKKGFKNFSKKERLAGDNNHPDRQYHIHRYDWDVKVDPDKESLEGSMEITFSPNKAQQTFLFDLQSKMKIEGVESSAGKPKVKRKGDLLFIIFENEIPKNARTTLRFDYGGKPVSVLKEGPIQWKTDEQDRPWISTSTEGIGPHFIMPCNALLQAEPDSCTIIVTVPKELTVVANGRYAGKIESGDYSTYAYSVNNPINIYNISFNIGHFVEFNKDYTDINGEEQKISCHVLDYHQEIAESYYDQAPLFLKEFEELFGVFPWWNDGCKFIESTFSAMEHQSGIAMGDDYTLNWKNEFNTTLIHEMAHEWWGNSLTGSDYCDMWMHEGMATYAEALMLERLKGEEDYFTRVDYFIYSAHNRIPVYKECGVLYNSWTNDQDQDIYDKGALVMHSLRMMVDDDAKFFAMLKQVYQEFAGQNVRTADFTQRCNELLGSDYSELFATYLYQAEAPTLQVHIDREASKIYYRWASDIGFLNGRTVPIKVGEVVRSWEPTTAYQSEAFVKGTSVEFMIEHAPYYVLDIQKKKE